MRLQALASKILLLVVGVLFGIQVTFALKYSIDIPCNDTWSLFDPGRIQRAFDLGWLLGFHNEHRIFTTKLAAWILYRINDLNLVHLLAVGHLYFGAAVVVTLLLLRNLIKAPLGWLAVFGTALLMTPLNWENHVVPFHMQFHASMFFSLLYLHLVFSVGDRNHWTWSRVLSAGFCGFLGAFSFAGGVIQMIAAFGVLLITVGSSAGWRAPKVPKTAWGLIVLTFSVIALYFVGYQKPGHHPDPILPLSLQFWRFYAELLSLGFGLREISVERSTMVLFISHAPAVFLLVKTRFLTKANSDERKIIAASAGLVLIIASVASARFGFGLVQAKQV
ncbi:MAG TPA: hypothetical protein PLH57_02900, partial [Oligoflexia bacterium]|nr:hypothetical protein [Oligoflexia bacterium]